MKKTKIVWRQLVRRAIQLLSFILVPGLFVTVFTALKSVFTALIGGTFNFGTFIPQLILIFVVFAVTIFMGRFFCGYICSFGSMGDLIWFISKKIRKNPRKINEKADRILKYFKYIFLLFIIIFIWTLGTVSFDSSLNPWNVFGMYTTISGWASLSALLSIGGLLLLLIMIGSYFVERFFCRYLCPLGALFSILTKLRILRIKKSSEKCGACRFCTSNCPMGIPMYKYDKIDSGECISCSVCVDKCPRKNISLGMTEKDLAPMAAGLVASAAILGSYYIGNIFTNTGSTVQYSALSDVAITDQSQPSGQYTDGTYTGSANGYRGTTTVQVTVENGYITGIEVLSTGDDSQFFNLAESPVINSILESQSTEVDAVTGATYSSDAIMDAVADAIGTTWAVSADQESSAPQSTPESVAATQSQDNENSETSQQASTGDLKDGIYTGTGTGYRGEIEVSVTVSGGDITNIEILSYQDDRPYLDQASGTVIEEIINSQSAEVDAVSGATYTSNGIMEAVADALDIEFTTETTSEGGGHHGGRR